MKSEDLLIIENLVCRPKSDYLQHTITTEDRSEGHLFWKREWKHYEVRITWKDGGYAARTFDGETEENKRKAQEFFDLITSKLC